MEFESIKVPKVSDSIVSQIEEMILDGVLKPGDRLPPERELAQKLEVSRPSLREAIVVLEARGLLQARRGGGTYVCDLVAPTVMDPLIHLLQRRPETTFDILELRVALEEIAAYFAASRSNDLDRQILKLRFEELQNTYEEYEPSRNAEADVEFHMAIADASHNVALVHVMRGLFNLLRRSINDNLQKLLTEEENIELVSGQHESIYNAIMAGAAEEARAAVHAHLTFVEATLREFTEEAARENRSRRRLQSLDD
jgi:GntR family transcriptional repressor for pyruvate dehydrogenase complex